MRKFMDYYTLITKSRPTFICGDIIDEIKKGDFVSEYQNPFPQFIIDLRKNNCEPKFIEFYRTLDVYNLATPKISGLIINFDAIKNDPFSKNTIDILIMDLYVAIVCQYYLSLDKLLISRPLDTSSSESFMLDVQNLNTARQNLQKTFKKALQVSTELTPKHCKEILNFKFKMNNESFYLRDFYAKTQENLHKNFVANPQHLLEFMEQLTTIKGIFENEKL